MPPIGPFDTLSNSFRRALFGSSRWTPSWKELQKVTSWFQVQVLFCGFAIVAMSAPVTVSSALLIKKEGSAIAADLNGENGSSTFIAYLSSGFWTEENQAELGQESRQLAQHVANMRASITFLAYYGVLISIGLITWGWKWCLCWNVVAFFFAGLVHTALVIVYAYVTINDIFDPFYAYMAFIFPCYFVWLLSATTMGSDFTESNLE